MFIDMGKKKISQIKYKIHFSNHKGKIIFRIPLRTTLKNVFNGIKCKLQTEEIVTIQTTEGIQGSNKQNVQNHLLIGKVNKTRMA